MDNKNTSKNKGGLKGFLKSRKARYGAAATAILLITVALVIVLNIVVGMLVERFPNLKLDLTANKAYELQDDTVDYMSHLTKDVNLYILSTEDKFVGNGEYFVQAKNLLEKIESSSDGKLKLQYIDTTSNPGFTQKYPNVDWDSSKNLAIVECGKQYKSLTLDECFEYDQEYAASYGYYDFTGTTIEQAVVTAVLNVTTDDKIIADILTGNQEADYSAVSTLLNNNAYQVNEISLLTADIDADAKFLLLYAPAVDFDDDAIQKISNWLDNDGKYGKTLIYIPSATNTNTPNLDAFLEEWKLTLSEGYVFETSSDHLLNGVSEFAFLTDYSDYYTENLKNPDIPVVTMQSRGITIGDESTAHALLSTSDKAGIMPYEPAEDWDYNDAITGKAIPVAAESVKSGNEAESKLIVFGSEYMFRENFLSINSFNNSAFLINIFNTIGDKDDDSVTIESKSLESTELGITDASTAAVMFVVFSIVIPVAVLVVGLIVWLRRRNK